MTEQHQPNHSRKKDDDDVRHGPDFKRRSILAGPSRRWFLRKFLEDPLTSSVSSHSVSSQKDESPHIIGRKKLNKQLPPPPQLPPRQPLRGSQVPTEGDPSKSVQKEATTSETISLRDPLPPEYQDVLERIPKLIPHSYFKKIQEAAYYFWSLDSGKELFDEAGNSLQQKVELMAQEIARSGFVGTVYLNIQLGMDNSPEESLPGWILKYVNDDNTIHLSPEQKERIVGSYQSYVAQHAASSQRHPNGIYDQYVEGVLPSGLETIAGTNQFKIYVEGQALEDFSAVSAALEELSRSNLHPYNIKLMEKDRLVLYFGNAPTSEISAQIRQIFSKHKVAMRGPAQDPTKLSILKDGNWQRELITSNDGSLGEGGHNQFTWEGWEYDEKLFFYQYIRLVINGAKDPTEPYMIGYVLVDVYEDKNNLRTQRTAEKLVERVQQEDQLPAIVNRGRVRF